MTSPSADESSVVKAAALNAEQKAWLQKYLPDFLALQDSEVPKGAKSQWVQANVLDEFQRKFMANSSRSEVLEKLKRWFYNQASKAGKTRPIAIKAPKKPKATNGEFLFRIAEAVHIREEMQNVRLATGEHDNLKLWRQVSKEQWDGLTDAEKEEWHAKAAAKNEEHKNPPPIKHIYDNQDAILTAVAAALAPLGGYDWNQLGDVAFFVQGAYRNAKGSVTTFHTSVHDGPTAFGVDRIENYKKGFRKVFKEWAEEVLPVHSAEVQEAASPHTVHFDGSGRPIIPALDMETITAKDLGKVMEELFIGLWARCGIPSVSKDVPWALINDHRAAFLTNTAIFRRFKTIRPSEMIAREVFEFADIVQHAPANESFPIAFLIENEGRQLLGLGGGDRDDMGSPPPRNVSPSHPRLINASTRSLSPVAAHSRARPRTQERGPLDKIGMAPAASSPRTVRRGPRARRGRAASEEIAQTTTDDQSEEVEEVDGMLHSSRNQTEDPTTGEEEAEDEGADNKDKGGEDEGQDDEDDREEDGDNGINKEEDAADNDDGEEEGDEESDDIDHPVFQGRKTAKTSARVSKGVSASATRQAKAARASLIGPSTRQTAAKRKANNVQDAEPAPPAKRTRSSTKTSNSGTTTSKQPRTVATRKAGAKAGKASTSRRSTRNAVKA